MKKNFGILSVLGLLLATASGAIEKPNIIIFYVDDLGWQDVQLNELDNPCPYETPNIQKLASAGMNLTQGYAPATCCSPSRAGIITGQHPGKIRFTSVQLGSTSKSKATEALVSPYLDAHLDTELFTLADAMKQNGYLTGHSGKWHVGLSASSYGFEVVDQDRGAHRSMPDRTKDFSTADDEKYPLSVEKYAPVSEKKPEGISYPYDQVTESALKFMKESGDQPFFLNLCHWMVHWPVLTRNGELLEYYCDKLGYPFPPEPGDMTRKGQQNPYFAAMVTTVDWSLGRVMDFLEQTDDPRHPGKKLSETTYIFFSSDNGGAEKHSKEVISDNYPLKYGKTHPEEGGIRVPTIIAGPQIEAGSQFDGLINQLDFFPTILKMTHSQIADKDFEALDGLDITALLTGKSQGVVDSQGAEREYLFWHDPHGGSADMKASIRSGDYKLHKRFLTDDYELYRLYKNGERDDLEEAIDLAMNPEYSSVVERLASTLDAELEANDVEFPYLNPLYNGHKTPVATLGNSKFNAKARVARQAVEKAGPKVVEAYVVYRDATGAKKHRRATGPASAKEALFGKRASAKVAEDGRSVTAKIPDEVDAYSFIIIDANNYMQHSKMQLVK